MPERRFVRLRQRLEIGPFGKRAAGIAAGFAAWELPVRMDFYVIPLAPSAILCYASPFWKVGELAMTKSALLAAVSIFALCASSAFVASAPTVPFRDQFELLKAAKGAKVLYNQNSNYTCCAVPSVNYTSGSLTSYDSQAADDFVVPKGRLWKVGELDVFGAYGGGSGPAGSENVIFYRDTNGVPGGAVKNGEFLNLHGTEKSGSFVITLPNKGLKLSAGRYWISIVANMTFANGTWAWKVNGMQHGNQAMWQNPNGGIGRCQTWGTIEECEGSIGPDLMFELRGTSKQK